MDSVGPYLADVALRTGLQLLLLLGPALVLGLAMHVLAGFVERRAVGVLGRRAWLVLFGWLGTVVHETGHAMFCVVFGHRITAFKPFTMDPKAQVLGYVGHEYDPRSLWARLGNFFIGIGPVILGTAVIYLAALLLLAPGSLGRMPEVDTTATGMPGMLANLVAGVAGTVGSTLAGVFRWQHLSQWTFWVFLYVAFSVGTAIRLSPPDLKGAAGGFLLLVLLLLLVNLATAWMVDLTDPLLRVLSPATGVFLGVMSFALALSALFALVFWGLSRIAGPRGA